MKAISAGFKKTVRIRSQKDLGIDSAAITIKANPNRAIFPFSDIASRCVILLV
jgi:hypothetical protein